jgi:hypothetical protein
MEAWPQWLAPYFAPEMGGHFRHNAVFIASNVREAINDGRADYTPIYLSEIGAMWPSLKSPRRTLTAILQFWHWRGHHADRRQVCPLRLALAESRVLEAG